MLGLHYVPGSHGSHGSQIRSRRGGFSRFCLCVQVLLSLATFSHGLSRSAVTEARRRATVCHGWFYVSSRPAIWFSGERMQQLGYFSLFIARELRIEDVNAFQASKALRNC